MQEAHNLAWSTNLERAGTIGNVITRSGQPANFVAKV